MEILSALAFGTFYFWVIVGVAYFIISMLIETERGGWATVTFISFTLILHFVGAINLGLLFSNIGLFALYFIGYLIVGILWSLLKWYFYLKKWSKEHINDRKEMLGMFFPSPRERENRRKIIRWMCYWPFSIAGTILNLKLFYKKLYELVGGLFEGISERAKKNFLANRRD